MLLEIAVWEMLVETVLTNTPVSLSSIQCFGAATRFRCFFGPLAWRREEQSRSTSGIETRVVIREKIIEGDSGGRPNMDRV